MENGPPTRIWAMASRWAYWQGRMASPMGWLQEAPQGHASPRGR